MVYVVISLTGHMELSQLKPLKGVCGLNVFAPLSMPQTKLICWYCKCFDTCLCFRYLNQQHIKKQKVSEAELTYGSLSIDQNETIKEIGELGLDIWRKQMIEPLRY